MTAPRDFFTHHDGQETWTVVRAGVPVPDGFILRANGTVAVSSALLAAAKLSAQPSIRLRAGTVDPDVQAAFFTEAAEAAMEVVQLDDLRVFIAPDVADTLRIPRLADAWVGIRPVPETATQRRDRRRLAATAGIAAGVVTVGAGATLADGTWASAPLVVAGGALGVASAWFTYRWRKRPGD